MRELKRKGVSLIISTWPIRATVINANAAFKCVGCILRSCARPGDDSVVCSRYLGLMGSCWWTWASFILMC